MLKNVIEGHVILKLISPLPWVIRKHGKFLSREAICSELCSGKINLARIDKMGGLTDGGGGKLRSIAVVQVGGTEQKSETREHWASRAAFYGWRQRDSGHTEKTQR